MIVFIVYTSARARTHTHTHTSVYRPLVWDYQGRPVPEETLTHSHPSWSSDILYQLPPFASASSISSFLHSILCVQFTCLTVLSDNLSPGPLWSSSWSWALYILSTSTSSTSTSCSMHFFTQSSSSLRST